MSTHDGIARRHVLGMAVAVGSLAMFGGVSVVRPRGELMFSTLLTHLG
jgi:hypothetical protein